MSIIIYGGFLSRKPLILLLPFLALLAGCATANVYDNVLLPVNLSREGDKVYAAGGYGSNGFGFNAGLPIMPPVQVAVTLQKNYTEGDKNLPQPGFDPRSYSNSHTSEVYEIMAGTYFEPSENQILELFAGTGKGKGEDYVYTPEFVDFKGKTVLKSAKATYEKLFLQLNVGKRNNFTAYGIAVRWNQITFSDYEETHSIRGVEYSGSPEGQLWEMTFFGRAGGENVKFGFMTTFSFSRDKLKFNFPSFTYAGMISLVL